MGHFYTKVALGIARSITRFSNATFKLQIPVVQILSDCCSDSQGASGTIMTSGFDNSGSLSCSLIPKVLRHQLTTILYTSSPPVGAQCGLFTPFNVLPLFPMMYINQTYCRLYGLGYIYIYIFCFVSQLY